MATIQLKLDGLHCHHCVKSVEKALGEIEGVEKVIVSLEPQFAIVEGNVEVDLLLQTIDEIGFDAKLA